MKWTSLNAVFTVVLVLFGLAESARGDISEYFLRDPYDQLDLFRQSSLRTKDKASATAAASASKEEESIEKANDDGLYEEYYDYLYDVGVLPAKDPATTTSTTTTTTTPKPKSSSSQPRIQSRISSLTVADDVLGRVKKPKAKRRKTSKKRYNYRPHRDNVAAENAAAAATAAVAAAAQKRQGKPVPFRNFAKAKPMVASNLLPHHSASSLGANQPRDLPGLENVERLIPSSLKTVIEDSGKRIVKAVMQPINSIPRNTRIKV